MKQKGKRFFVEEKPKKKKNKIEEPDNFEIEDNQDSENYEQQKSSGSTDSSGDFKTKPFSLNDKSDKNRSRMKEKVSKQLEKNRAKVLRKNAKSSKKSIGTDKWNNIPDNNGKILKFEQKGSDSRFERIKKSVRLHKKNVVLSVIIIVVLLLSVLVFSNRDRLSFSSIKNWVQYGVLNMNSEEVFPVSTDGDVISNGNFSRIERNLVFASDTKFVTMNNYGRTIFQNPQAFANPVLCQANDSDMSLVYNLGAKGFSVYTLDSMVYTGEAEDNIIIADIAKNGTYALVTEKDGYLSKLYVYSNENKQIFAYSFADYYITSVSLNSKGDSAVLTGLSAHDGTQYSAVYLLDFTKDEPVIFEEFEDNILYYTKHLTNNYVCIIGDTAAYTLNVITKNFSTTSYEGKSLTAFDVNTDTNNYTLSLSRSGDGRKCDILVFSTSGTLKKTISTELMITAISTYKNRVGVLSSGNIYLYSKDGNLLSEKNAGLDPHSLVLYSTTDAYILGVSEIRRIDF